MGAREERPHRREDRETEDMNIRARVVSFGVPWIAGHTLAVEGFWKPYVSFEWDFIYANAAAAEMKEWGQSLAVLDDPVVRRWAMRVPDRQDTYDFHLNVFCAAYQPPKSFLGLIYDNRASVSGLYIPSEQTIEVFSNEGDTASSPDDGDPERRVFHGSAFSHWLNHELSHFFYQRVFAATDNTHTHFYAGHPERAREEIFSLLGVD